ncbi:MAG: glycosyltransferase family 4 protein [Chloroflexi bacterium]|nr:glycosyltransferase family 4 protein [Chloroflexota bacterium]
MHIMLISTYGFDPSFPSRPEFVLARTLAEMGHTVSAVEYWHQTEQPQRVEFASNLTIYRCKTTGFFSYDLLQLQRHIPRPDIIHVHHLRHLLAYQAQKQWRSTVPMVLTPHGILHDGDLVVDRERPLDHPLTPHLLLCERNQLLSALLNGKHPRKLVRNFLIHAPLLRYHGIFALSNHEKSILTSLGANQDSIDVIPNSVELLRYDDNTHPKFARPTLLFIGQLVPRKGWDVAIRALPAIRAQIPDVQLIMITHNTSQLQQLETLANELDVRDMIDLRTRVNESEKVALLKQAHVLVAPSRYEGFGIPPIEAMAAGCGVVTTDCAAGNEVVTHEVTGLLSRYDDAADVAAQVLRLMTNQSLYDTVTAQGHAYVHATYHPHIVATQTLTGYQRYIR